MVGYECDFEQHRPEKHRNREADIDTSGNFASDVAKKSTDCVTPIGPAPLKGVVSIGCDKMDQKQIASRSSQQYSLSNMMLMMEYAMSDEQAKESDPIDDIEGVISRLGQSSSNDLSISSITKEQDSDKNSIMKELQNPQIPSMISIQEPNGTADNLANRFIVKRANSTRHRRRSCNGLNDIKDMKASMPFMETKYEVVKKREPIDQNKPKSWADRIPSNVVDCERRGLQRSTSLRMIPTVSFSTRTSNFNNSETIHRQASRRHILNSSFSSRGSGKRMHSVRQSSNQMAPNASTSSFESNGSSGNPTTCRETFRQRSSSKNLVRNVSYASRNSNSSSDTLRQREKGNRRVSSSTKRSSKRNLDSPVRSFTDRVTEQQSAGVRPFQKSNTSCMEDHSLHTPRRSSMNLKTYFDMIQNEIDPPREWEKSSRSGETCRGRQGPNMIFEACKGLQKRRGSTGTIGI